MPECHRIPQRYEGPYRGRGRYGAPRCHRMLRRSGPRGRHGVRDLYRAQNLHAVPRCRKARGLCGARGRYGAPRCYGARSPRPCGVPGCYGARGRYGARGLPAGHRGGSRPVPPPAHSPPAAAPAPSALRLWGGGAARGGSAAAAVRPWGGPDPTGRPRGPPRPARGGSRPATPPVASGLREHGAFRGGRGGGGDPRGSGSFCGGVP